jgi:CysZ protein
MPAVDAIALSSCAMNRAERPGFIAGLKSLWGGIAWLVKTPDAWPYAVVPIAIAIGLMAALSWTMIAFVPNVVDRIVEPGGRWFVRILHVVVQLLAYVLSVVLSGLLSFMLAQPLSGPALEALVRRRERDLGLPPRAKTSFWTDIWRSLKSLLVSYMFGVPAMILLFGLSLVVPAAAIVLFPLELVVAAVTISWDLCDYPLSMRGMPVGQRISTILHNFPALLGFSLGLALVGLVPCLLFLALPAGVAGATDLMAQLDRARDPVA